MSWSILGFIWYRFTSPDRILRVEGERDAEAAEEQEAREAAEAAERKALARINKEYGEVYDEVKGCEAAVERLHSNEPEDMMEAASVVLSSHKILWGDDGVRRGMKSETGYGEGERRKMFGMFASRENGGVSLRRLAEDPMKEVCEAHGIAYDSREAMDALLDVLQAAAVPSDIRKYIEKRRMAQALELKRQEDAYLREQYEEWCREMYHMSADEYEAYEEYMSEELKNLDENFDEKEYFDNIADEISNIEKNGYREIQKDASEREGSGNGGSGEVLSAERAVQGGGDATDAGQPGLSERDGIQGDGAERPVLESTPGRSEVRPGFDGGVAAAEGAGGQGLRPGGSGAEQADAAAAGDGAGAVSTELDENGHPFILSKDGTTTFGEIREGSGLQSAPIKLSRGFQSEDGKGYGLLHIEAGHGEQIRKAGFSSVEEFVSFVAQNYDENNIRIGKRRNNGSATYIIQVSDRLDNTLFIELSHDGSYWNVNSGGIFRKGYADKKETVAKTEPRQPDNAVSGGSSLPKDENAGISSIGPNGEPTVSGGKGNALPGDTQADGAESSEPYTITPTTYTNKRGKTSDVHFVKFGRELTAGEKDAAYDYIDEPLEDGKKTKRGWYDRKRGGYMMRSEEAARGLGELIGGGEADSEGAVVAGVADVAEVNAAQRAVRDMLVAKEAKYAEMDKTVEAAADVSLSGEDEESGDGSTRYRDGGEMSDGERLRAIRALEPIVVEHNDLSKDELREVYGSLPGVEKDGRLVEFYRSAFKKIYKEGGLFGQVVPVLDDVLDNSVLAYSEADKLGGMVRPDGTIHKEHPNVDSFDNYVGKVNIGGKEYYVRTTVKREIGQTGTHSFFVSDVSLYEKDAPRLTLPNFPSGESYMERSINPTESRTIPITSRGSTDFNGVLDAKLRQFFERANSEAKILDMRDRAEDLSERLGTPVRLVETREEAAKLPTRRERRAKGFYNTETGEVVVVLPNHANVADVENTVLHEVVGHEGLRVLFPTEEKLNNALDELYGASEDRIREEIDARTQRMVDAEAERLFREKQDGHETVEDANANFYGDKAEAYAEANAKREEYRREATEEYGADLAGKIGEEGFERMSREELTFWGKLKSKLQRALENLLRGLKIPKMRKWRDREWAYVLHKAYKAKKNGGKPDVFEAAEDAAMRARAGIDEPMEKSGLETERADNSNTLFNEELSRFQNGEMAKNEILHLGVPEGIIRHFMPRLPIVMRQRILTKGSVKRHNVDVGALRDMPFKISKPIFIFKRSDNQLGVLTEMRSRDGKNVFVAIELNKTIQNGGDFLEVNDIRSIHDRNIADIVYPIIQNGTLRWVDKAKGLAYLSSASRYVQQEIDKRALNDATKLVENFENPKFEDEENEKTIRFRDGDMGLDEYVTKIKVEAAKASGDNLAARHDAMKAIGGNLNKLRQAMARQREYDTTTVRSVTDLARVFMDEGLLDDLSKMEMKRILGSVNRVVGRQDTAKEVQKVLDIMVDNQLRLSAKAFGSLLKVKGSRVNAAGVEVQGELDVRGQQMVQVLKKGIRMQPDEVQAQIDDALDRMGSDDAAVAEAADIELDGLLTAKWYIQEIKGSKTEEQALRDSIKEAKEEKDKGNMTEAAYRQYVAATEDAIRQNKIERAEQYAGIVERLGMKLGDSTERAKAWRAAEKARVDEIHHNANSDMEGRVTDEHHKPTRTQKALNSDAARFLLAPLATFDQMLRMLGRKNVRGEGYLWNRFMRGWEDATEKEYLGYRQALEELDAKVKEIWGKKGMKWSALFRLDRKLPTMRVKFMDGGEMKEHVLTQGNLLYIYMVDKMSDGRMKLRKMGITEDDIEAIKKTLDPKFMELGDWLQEEYLVGKRNKYNEVHRRMFGASMAAIENYFPLKILKNARTEEVDVATDTGDATATPATTTGSIIKRRRNNLALDITGANALTVILDHLQEMEKWSAFAEFNRDLNTLLSYKRFRNQVMNMTSAYGAGAQLWEAFKDVCKMAAGSYRPPVSKLNKTAVNFAKGVTAAKVSFRIYTALKQLLSFPAYLSDANPVYLAANVANPIGAWRWCMRNLPLFHKRWFSRMAGDPRLLKTEMDWKMWRSRAVQIASRLGMSPNAFVDALTVAIGAHAMYQTKLAKYKRYGYTPEEAERRARQDATILFNQTQQSSESAFLSTMQVDKDWISTLFTVFRNSAMSYTRQEFDAFRNIGHRLAPGYKRRTEEFMTKQMERDGIEAGLAAKNAKNEYRNSWMRDLTRLAR